jgi:hypothetical protein
MYPSVLSIRFRRLNSKYTELRNRLQKALNNGNFVCYSQAKKQAILRLLYRYERQLKQWGVAVGTSAFLLAPAPQILAQAVPAGSELRVNTYTTGSQRLAAVAIDSDGDFVVTWEGAGQGGDNYGIYAQRYDNAGVAQGSEFQVNSYTTSSQSAPAIAIDSDGDFVIAWNSYGQAGYGAGYDVYAQRYNSAGVAQGSEFRVNTISGNSQANPSIAMDSNGNFVIAWESLGQDNGGFGVYAKRYNNAGIVQGTEFLVNIYSNTNQLEASAAMDSNGNFVIVWHSDFQDGSAGGIYAQRYNSTGVAQGSEFQVNNYTTYTQTHPSVAMDSNGNFAVAWLSDEQDGSSFGIYVQRYNSSGVTQGSEFPVNTFTTGVQTYPVIAMSSDGHFIITWMSYSQDGSSSGIYAQAFDNTGITQGSEFRINTYTTGSQEYQAVGMDSGGNFVVAWNSNLQDGDGFGIYAQRYTLPILPIELLYFTGHAETTSNILEWATATEKNSQYHILERSPDGIRTWEEIGRKSGAGTATDTRHYLLRDENPLDKAYYRLRSVDLDGKAEVFDMIFLEREGETSAIVRAFPVPFESEINLQVNIPSDRPVTMTVTDMLGQVFHSTIFEVPQGSNILKADLSHLPAGNYFIQLVDGKETAIVKVVKQ